jgi:hypothetical protein
MLKKNCDRFIQFTLITIGVTVTSFAVNIHALKEYDILGMGTDLTDSGHFTPNVAEGWSLYSSYLEIETDSVEFELILKRNAGGNYNWYVPSLTGRSEAMYAPAYIRVLIYNEPNRKWEITFQPDGCCYIKLLTTTVSLDSINVIPIKIKYKK